MCRMFAQPGRRAMAAHFWADVTDPVAPKVTTAEQATVDTGGIQRNHALARRHQHELVNTSGTGQYQVSTFAESELPLAVGVQDETHIGHSDTPILAMSNRQLFARARAPDGRWYMIELHKRFAYPAACIVLMLIGIPLGMSSRQGGKSAGFVLSIALVFYLLLPLLDRGRACPPREAAGLRRRMGREFPLRRVQPSAVAPMATGRARHAAGLLHQLASREHARRRPSRLLPSKSGRRGHGRFPLILDEYILREFLMTFVMVLVSFVMLMLVFTFFELLGDIIRNRTPLVTVGEYLINLTPSMIYTITPLGVLVSVLSHLRHSRPNQRAHRDEGDRHQPLPHHGPGPGGCSHLGGCSLPLRRIVLAHGQPTPGRIAQRDQGAARSDLSPPGSAVDVRPGKARQTGRIFYYQFFDADHDRFANVSVFEFDPENFSLSRRIFASSAHWEPQLNQWVFEQGWERSFTGEAVSGYSQFNVESFPEIVEEPQYFKKEARQSQEMTFGELDRYIRDLRQSGFDTKQLSVQLNRKLAFPLITLVMAALAIPFALSMGKRGSLTGIAAAIGLAIGYWMIASTFEALGDVNMLPSMVAAWYAGPALCSRRQLSASADPT